MRRLTPIQFAYVVVTVSIFIERLLRQGETARSFQQGAEDQQSTRAVGSAWAMSLVALLIAPLLNKMQLGRVLSDKVGWGGAIATVAGLALRTWSTRVLGAYYTRTLRTQQGQRLIQEGPYRLVRHPGYAGSLLLWLGAGVATTNMIVVVVIAILFVRAYMRRMEAEETMLANTFPEEYPAYARHTRRIVPFVY